MGALTASHWVPGGCQQAHQLTPIPTHSLTWTWPLAGPQTLLADPLSPLCRHWTSFLPVSPSFPTRSSLDDYERAGAILCFPLPWSWDPLRPFHYHLQEEVSRTCRNTRPRQSLPQSCPLGHDLLMCITPMPSLYRCSFLRQVPQTIPPGLCVFMPTIPLLPKTVPLPIPSCSTTELSSRQPSGIGPSFRQPPLSKSVAPQGTTSSADHQMCEGPVLTPGPGQAQTDQAHYVLAQGHAAGRRGSGLHTGKMAT